MSRIGDGTDGPGGPGSASNPWPDEAGAQVRRLRRAITSRMNGEPVDTDVAPLLPDLLTRLDQISESESTSDLHAPEPPEKVAPPSPSEHSALLRRAESKLRDLAAGLQNSQEVESVRHLIETIDRYRTLREEVLMRTEL